MNRIINRVRLYVKDTNNAHHVEQITKKALLKHKFELDDNCNLDISIGGDGTFIKMLHHTKFNSNYYAAINAGSLGFLSSVDGMKVEEFISDLNKNKFITKEIDLLKVKVCLNNNTKELYCINEFTIRNSDFSTFKADVYVDDKLLEKYSGDGLIINSPIGSTGYNLALNGAIIDRDIKAFSITPLVPINNKVYKSLINSIILSSNKKVTIIPHSNSNLCYVCDGIVKNINNCSKIECVLEKTIKCIYPSNYDYIDVIKTKIIDTKE